MVQHEVPHQESTPHLPVGGTRHSGSEFCALFWRSRLVRTSKAIPTLTSTEAAKLPIAVSLQKTSWKSGRQPRANTRPWRRRPAMCKPAVFLLAQLGLGFLLFRLGGLGGCLFRGWFRFRGFRKDRPRLCSMREGLPPTPNVQS